MQWFDSVESAAKLVSKDVPLKGLIDLCKVVLRGYGILYGDGLIKRVLHDDLNSNISRVEQTLQEMDEKGVVPLDGKLGMALNDLTIFCALPESGGCYGIRWICRTLRFVVVLLSKLGEDPNLSISVAGRATYKEVLSQYHAPVMQFVVGCVLYWAPTRAWVLSHTLNGATNELATASCAKLALALSPVPAAIEEHLNKMGLDYNDRISSVPGGF